MMNFYVIIYNAMTIMHPSPLNRARHRNGRLLEPVFFPKPLGWGLEEYFHMGGGHLENVVFKKR
jgi:hypothetical protein